MKKILLLLSFTYLPFFLFGQALELPYTLDFDDTQTIPSNIALINVDEATPNEAGLASMTDSAWIVSYRTEFESNVALGVSYYQPETGADDWMILPKIKINDNTAVTWDALSLTTSGDYPDSYEVYISTTTQDIEGCQANPVLLHVTDESPTKIQHRRINLADAGYANQEVYIAFRLMTQDPGGDRLAIDNILVQTDPIDIDEDFNNGLPESWTVINNNGDSYTWQYDNEGYGIYGSNCVAIQTWDDQPFPADDYLVSPKITVNEGDVLSFLASSSDSDYPDSFTIFASKTEVKPSAFSITIGSEEGVPAFYRKYQYVLTDNENISAGDEIYLAVYCNSDGFFLNLDNFRVGEYRPPKFERAYSVNENTIEVIYDIPVSQNDVNLSDIVLSGTMDIAFNNFTIHENEPAIVFFTDPSETINPDLILDSMKNTGLDESVEFYAGISPVSYTSLTNPDGHLQEGYFASFKAMVMAKNINDEGNRVWLSDGSGAHNGVNAFGNYFYTDCGDIGDEIMFYGKFSPYKNQTEIYPAYFIETVSTGNDLYEATIISGSDIAWNTTADSDPAEQYEGTMVMIENATVDSWDGAYFKCTDDGGTTKFYVGNQLGLFDGTFDENVMTEDNTYNIVGFLANYNGEYAVNPRGANDLANLSGIDNRKAETCISMYPNPVRNRLQIRTTTEMQTIIITNVAGQEVVQLQNVMSKGMEISTSQLEKGVYFATIFDVDNNKQTLKFVKQ